MPAKKAAGDAAAKPAVAPAPKAESKPAAEKRQGGGGSGAQKAGPPRNQAQAQQGQGKTQGGAQSSPSTDHPISTDPAEATIQRKINALEAKVTQYRSELDKVKNEIDAEKDVLAGFKKEKDAINAALDADDLNSGGASQARKATIEKVKELKRLRQLKKDEAQKIKAKLPHAPPPDDSAAAQEAYLKKLEDDIRQFERNLAGRAVSLAEEKRRVEEISQLREAKTVYKEYVTVSEKIRVDSAQIKEIEAELDKTKDAGAGIRELRQQKIDQRKEVNEKMLASRDRTDALHATRKEINEKINTARDDSAKERENLQAYKKKRWEQQKEKREKDQERYLAQKAERDAKRQAYEDSRKKEEDAKIPYEDELYHCDSLVKYLETLLPPKPKEETSNQAAAAVAHDANVTVLKKEEEEDFKKKSKKQKPVKVTQDLKHNVDVFVTFETISVNPPSKLSDVEASINEVKAKKEHYQKLSTAAQNERKEKAAAAAAAAAAAPAPSAEATPATTSSPAASSPAVERASAVAETPAGDEIASE